MEKKFIRFKLAKEDTDLISWKNSLPTRSFNETINKILVSESIGQLARIPCEFSSSEVAEETDASFYVDDENVLALLVSIWYCKRFYSKHNVSNASFWKCVVANVQCCCI